MEKWLSIKGYAGHGSRRGHLTTEEKEKIKASHGKISSKELGKIHGVHPYTITRIIKKI